MTDLNVICVADRGTGQFRRARLAVDIVCAGDSITGWNNFGPLPFWPYPTYPQFLQKSCLPLELRIANGGIAGEVSQNGIGQVEDYLVLFPNARYFIIGYGTNDLGTWPDIEVTSRRIIENLNRMVRAVIERGKRPILFNVPYANESMFPPDLAEDLHVKRDYHNAKLKDYCGEKQVPLADICSRLLDQHLADELHPNGAGARIIAEAVFQVLRQSTPRPPSREDTQAPRPCDGRGVVFNPRERRTIVPVSIPIEEVADEGQGVYCDRCGKPLTEKVFVVLARSDKGYLCEACANEIEAEAERTERDEAQRLIEEMDEPEPDDA